MRLVALAAACKGKAGTVSDHVAGDRPGAVCVAVLGAESTGKTTLARDLALALAASTGPGSVRAAWVPELLRQWCDKHGRTPQAHEQAAILQEQHARITATTANHDVVICDTTGVMTAVYSELIFGDRSLHPLAVALHRRMAFSLLTALDLPWVPDSHQRDGPQVRMPVDNAIRALLAQHALPFAVIGGCGQARLRQGLAALAPLLRQRLAPGSAAASGLFTRLEAGPAIGNPWSCECCGDATFERALRSRDPTIAPPTAHPDSSAAGCPPG